MHAGYARDYRIWQTPRNARPVATNCRWPTLLSRGAFDSARAPEYSFTSCIEPAAFVAIVSSR
jgi:hypothetical protein